jgi:hypothetical protein
MQNTSAKSKKIAAKVVVLDEIAALEKARDSKVIVYVTSDKKPENIFSTQVAPDVLPYFKKILKKIGDTKKITLALCTNGGLLDTPWPLVNLIRGHCQEFEVVILDKALSAGTMISLGADKIVMTRYASLSPIDPAANIPDANNQVKHVEIEDIIGYIDFVKDKIGITEQTALGDIMKDLTKEVTPTMLGSTNRTHSLVRRLAKNLLNLHKEKVPERKIKEIIEHLSEKLYSHRHLINRNEAIEIGLDGLIDFSDNANEKVIEALTDKYTDYLEIEKDFNPIEIIGSEDRKEIVVNRAVIHSSVLKYSFQSTFVLTKIPDPAGNPQVNVSRAIDKWNKV